MADKEKIRGHIRGQYTKVAKREVQSCCSSECGCNGTASRPKLDGLFAARDRISEQQNMATLSEAYQEIVADFLDKAGEQEKFDKDVFTQLVGKIIVKSREQIIFILKDGTEIEGITENEQHI